MHLRIVSVMPQGTSLSCTYETDNSEPRLVSSRDKLGTKLFPVTARAAWNTGPSQCEDAKTVGAKNGDLIDPEVIVARLKITLSDFTILGLPLA